MNRELEVLKKLKEQSRWEELIPGRLGTAEEFPARSKEEKDALAYAINLIEKVQDKNTTVLKAHIEKETDWWVTLHCPESGSIYDISKQDIQYLLGKEASNEK